MDDRGGRLELLLPYATLEPVREILLQMFMGEKFGRDSIWESHLSTELVHTDLELSAVLGNGMARLGEVLNWRVGSQLMLNSNPREAITMRCGEHPLFVGKIGRRNGNIAVRIDDEYKPEE
jgi:flagellar motor switch protein FliM